MKLKFCNLRWFHFGVVVGIDPPSTHSQSDGRIILSKFLPKQQILVLFSLPHTQMFNLLCEEADLEFGGRLPVHVHCIMDEFSNLGKIPDFEILISTIRSREISASIILQSLAQLKSIYDKQADIITDNCDSIEDADKKTKSTIETEAESTAYTVMSYFNLDDQVGDYSFSYIATWAADKDLKELKASMETIRKTASFIITGIEEKLLEKTSIKERLAAGEAKKEEHSGKQNKVKARQEPVLA